MKKLLAFILTLVMVASTLTMLPLSVSADAATPELLTYSQDYAGQPAGSGTEADPYKIETADDLLWMAKQFAMYDEDGTTPTDISSTTNVKPTMKPCTDKYYIQTADIELDGAILPSIGWCNGNSDETPITGSTYYASFSGTYDGQGYAIKNGYTLCTNPAYTTLTLHDWDNNIRGTGLFGVIDGATIKNVNLKNVKVYNGTKKLSIAGNIVGNAVGPATAEINHNKIINCTTDKDCVMTAVSSTGRSTNGSEKYYRWGGIVGSACKTLIQNCTNNAPISANNTIGYVGGIAGGVAGVRIENCVNNGTITITDINEETKLSNGAWRAFGGIVGGVSRKAANGYDVTIKNSCNTGNIIMDYTDEDVAASAYACAGILGLTRKMTNANECNVEYCYNLGSISCVATAGTAYSQAAIIGYVERNGTTEQMAVNIANVYSIPLTELDGGSAYGCLAITDTNNASRLWSYNENANGTITATNYGTKAVDELSKEADMACAADLYVQSHSNGSYRFLATINSADIEDWDKVGFEVTLVNNDGAKSNVKDVEVTKCYTAITANGKPVADANGRLFIVFVLKGDFSDIKGYEFSAYVTEGDNTYNTRIGTGDFG